MRSGGEEPEARREAVDLLADLAGIDLEDPQAGLPAGDGNFDADRPRADDRDIERGIEVRGPAVLGGQHGGVSYGGRRCLIGSR